MISLVSDLAPVVLGGLLVWTGTAKLAGRTAGRAAAGGALGRLLHDDRRTAAALRTIGAVELAVTAALLALPTAVLPGAAAAVLGAGFVGYLAWAKARVPEAGCGCTARRDTPITWRTFARAGLVLVAGAAAASATAPWWTAAGGHPLGALGVLAAGAATVVALSPELDRRWLLPLRRARLRLFGHPLGDSAGRTEVPLAASVDLLQDSLAWQAAGPIVRSGLVDHWDDGGWRFLQYSGVYEGEGGARPVTVVFALDAGQTRDTAARPAVRVAVVDAETGRPVAADLLAAAPVRSALPLAT